MVISGRPYRATDQELSVVLLHVIFYRHRLMQVGQKPVSTEREISFQVVKERGVLVDFGKWSKHTEWARCCLREVDMQSGSMVGS